MNRENIQCLELQTTDFGRPALLSNYRQPAVFMRRSALQAAGGLDPTFHFMLDHHLWIRLAQRGRFSMRINMVSSALSRRSKEHRPIC